MKIIYVLNKSDFLLSHRFELAIAAKKCFDVHVICPNDASVQKLIDLGFTVHSVEFGRNQTNPFSELRALFEVICLFKSIKPDLVHLITIKPYLYGGIAARLVKVPAVVSAVAGLGILFSSNALKYRLLRLVLYPLFKFAFKHNNQSVIFQNLDDKSALVDWNVVSGDQVKMIRGSGVDLESCPCIDEPNEIPVISFASRLLIDKGVVVFADASKIIKQRGINARFWLIGEADLGTANSVSQSQLDAWQKEGLVELFGFRKDIPQLFSQSNIVTLPSFYGEGLPKVLIEAAACGRAVITTDHPGCRDAIESGVSGKLIPIKDAVALADAIQYLIENPDKRKAMGKAGRILAVNVFDVTKVVEQHLNIYRELLNNV